MTDTLLAKATALLEARQKAIQERLTVDDFAMEDERRLRICTTDGTDTYYHTAKSVAEMDPEDIGLGRAELTADFFALAANTSIEIIKGYQDLVRQMAEILDQHDRYNYHEYMGTPLFEETKKVLTEARAAIPRTPMGP
jgi:hypothetical protein